MYANFENKATIHELSWYFDRVEQTRVEMGRLSVRNAQILMLRRDLHKLSDECFDAAMKAIEGVVSSYRVEERPTKEDQKRTRQRQQELYRSTQELSAEEFDTDSMMIS
ncbi:MAG: hypothetical protein AB8C84_05905 [Oligoflexales bacterium]